VAFWEASVLVSPALPFTTPRRIKTVKSSQLKSRHCRPMISLARRPRHAATITIVWYGSARAFEAALGRVAATESISLLWLVHAYVRLHPEHRLPVLRNPDQMNPSGRSSCAPPVGNGGCLPERRKYVVKVHGLSAVQCTVTLSHAIPTQGWDYSRMNEYWP
jgi:hypothetical protein